MFGNNYRFNANTTHFTYLYPRYKGLDLSVKLFILEIAHDFSTLNMNIVKKNVQSKNRIHYIMLLESEQFERESLRVELNQVFDNFWLKEILNVLVIYYSSNDLHVSSYNPFGSSVNSKEIFYNSMEVNHEILFREKTSNLNGYRLKATVFYDETRATFDRNDLSDVTKLDGADGLLTALFLEFMNATVVLMLPPDGHEIGEFLPNGSSTGCLGQLVRGEADFGTNVRFYRQNQFIGSVEASLTNGRDDICILVPRPGKETDIGNIFRAFKYRTWICVAVAIPTFTITYWLIYRIVPHQHHQRQNLVTIFFRFVGWNLSQSSEVIPSHWLKKFLIAIWIFYSLLIISLYQGKLSGNLIIPKDKADINSIEELEYSSFEIIAFARYNRQIRDFLNETRHNGTFNRLKKTLHDVSQTFFFDKIKNHSRNFAFANKHHINAHLRRTNRENGEVVYNEMKQCPVPYVTVYGLRYGMPYKGRMDYILRTAQEGGLIEKWDRVNSIQEKISSSKIQGGQQVIAFTLSHLQTSFFIYFIGIGVSLLTFAAELFMRKYFFL